MESVAATQIETAEPSQSPLFVPVLWRGDHFLVLDETRLPEEVAYIEVRDPEQALAAVKDMKTRAFGQVLTLYYTVALLAQTSGAKEFPAIRRAALELGERFRQVRSTFDFGGLVRLLFDRFGTSFPEAEAGPWLAARTREYAASIIQGRSDRARRTAELLPARCRLLTHCNVSGELVAMAQHCRVLGKELSVIATETRPYLQGARLTSWELSRAGIGVELIPDGACAQVMARGDANAVVVGADRCARNGDIVNKIGTYPLALAAQGYGIPFYALAQNPGLLASGSQVTIEQRPVHELLTFQDVSIAPEGVQGSYPAFDVVPAGLITRLIDFDGVFTPEEFREKYQALPTDAVPAHEEKDSFVLVFGIPREEHYRHLSSALRAEGAGAILVPEMRPGLWGARLIAHQLLARQLPTTVISDNAMGFFFARNRVRRVFLFCSELGREGPAGICGLLLTALLAHVHKVPVELLAADDEARPALDSDVTTFLGHRTCPQDVKAYPLTHDVAPWHLFHDT